jgi:hypothetical protein
MHSVQAKDYLSNARRQPVKARLVIGPLDSQVSSLPGSTGQSSSAAREKDAPIKSGHGGMGRLVVFEEIPQQRVPSSHRA